MSRPMVLGRLLVIVALATGAAACGGTVSSPTATVGPSAPVALSTTAATTAVSPAPTLTPDPPPPSLAEPPSASLAVDGGDPVTGSLGSFTWGDGGSDSPWLPGAPIAVGSGEPLVVTLADGVAVKDWLAKRVPAETTDGAGAIAIGDGAGSPITFLAPGPGDWSVQVFVTFGDGLGSAAYYWHVTVT